MTRRTEYDESSVDILEGLEPVRVRPEMYIGDTGTYGLHHILKEVIDNAIDEYIDGNVTMLGVQLDTERQVAVVVDNGRGIPVKMHPTAKIPTLTAVFTRLHSGGKFGDKVGRGAYTGTSVGLHGVGVKATNALSDQLSVWTKRDGNTYYQTFKRGIPASGVEISDKKLRSGTRVMFKPDFSIFKGVRFDPKHIRDLLSTAAHLCPGITIEFNVDGESEIFKSEGGLTSMLMEVAGDTALFHDPLLISTPEVDVALVWADRTGELWKSFVNVSPTPEHGTHVKGARRAIQDVITSYADDKHGKLKGDDIRDGLIGIVHAKVVGPKFSSQTKLSLVNSDVEDTVADIVSANLRRFATANQAVVRSVIERAVALRDAKQKFRAQQLAIRGVKVKQGTRGVLPGKLCEAPECSPADRELFLVEGDSAFGSAKDARIKLKYNGKDIHFQEILPLKGKSLNIAKEDDVSAALDNKELSSITQAIGTGVEPAFDMAKCRCGNVYILADADPDGKHITSILLSFFALHMPKLIEAGMVHVVQAPLFRGVTSKATAYGDSIEEVKKKLGTDKNVLISRFKGLGEADADDLEVFAMDPKRRKLVHVEWLGEEDRELVIRYMGKDVRYRKELMGVTR